MIESLPDRRDAAPLASDDDLWSHALAGVKHVLEMSIRGALDPPAAVFAVVTVAARLNVAEAASLVALVRRALVRSALAGESALRCLRALARAGEPVDLSRLAAVVPHAGRAGRLALMAIGEVAAREPGEALRLLVDGLASPLRAESAMVLSFLGCRESLDALARHLRTPGGAGVHAAAALVTFEDDPFAFEVLCERLCDPEQGLVAARALWGARPEGECLRAAESALASWARRGVRAAESGRWIAAATLTAGRVGHDMAATQRAADSEDDDLALVGAQAAYCLGDAERARSTLARMFRRGPAAATQAFRLLAQWADMGDDPAHAMLCGVLEHRPIDLGRAAIYESLAAATHPALFHPVSRAVVSEERVAAVEAARALARLRDPPSVIPPLWL